MDEVAPALGNDGCLFVTLDLTDKKSRQREYLMAALGLGDVWRDHSGKTGFALVIDPTTKRVAGKLTASQSAGDLEKTIRQTMSTH